MILKSISCNLIFTILVIYAEPTEKWFEQYVDHFNMWDNRTFKQRYFEDNSLYRDGGPLLLVIGAESEVDPNSLSWNPSRGVAKRLHGHVVLLEHRFYGESAPFTNVVSEDYQYLSVEQALEDVAYFIESFKQDNAKLKNCKVAVFGCSYGGSLATWFRYKFPHLVDAAWASSGPIRVTLDFYEFYEVTGEMYSNVSTECIAIIRQGYREAKTLMSTKTGLETVRKILEDWECGNTTQMSAIDILSTIRIVVSDQYAAPNHSKESCKFLESKNSSTSCFQQLAEYVISKSGEACLEESESDNLAWEYQTCTQFGYVSTTSSYKQPFKDDYLAIDAHIADCIEQFGDNYNKSMLQRGIERMNRVYGSTNLKITNVFTVHGTKDPWHRLGLLKSSNKDAPVIIIPGASHCSDDSENEYAEELPLIKKTKEMGIDLMEKWLK